MAIKRAVILAGGKGERLRPLTNDKPKTMVEIDGSPLMAYQLHWLQSCGVEEVVVACGYQHEVIQNYFGDGSKWQLKINYAIEKEPLGRGGALKNALAHFIGNPNPNKQKFQHELLAKIENELLSADRMPKNQIGQFLQAMKNSIAEPIIAMNGDMVTKLPLHELERFFFEHPALATLVTVPLKSPYGILDLKEGNVITGFREKPELPYWINAGIYILHPDIYDLLPDKGDHEELTFPDLAKGNLLRAFQSRHFWKTVDTVKDLSELSAELSSFPAEEKPLAVRH
jgi:NDP-sugar pyrophosphorylase family protein